MKNEGTITRKRFTTKHTVQSAISFVIVSPNLVEMVETVKVDEEQEYAPTRMTETKKGKKVEKKMSDHNVILTKFKMSWNKESKPERNSSFNLKNKECQKNI